MNNRKIIRAYKECAGVILLLLSATLSFQPSYAQQAQPTIMLSWSSHTLTPAGYIGKALPVLRSTLSVSADAIAAGRVLDLRNAMFRWHINGLPHEIGRGKQSISFEVKSPPRTALQVRLEVDYEGATFEKTTLIPIQEPMISIIPPYKENRVVIGENVFRVFPYFFKTISSEHIATQWYANGLRGESAHAGEPFVLTIPEDYLGPNEIILSLHARNTADPRESASKEIIVTLTQ